MYRVWTDNDVLIRSTLYFIFNPDIFLDRELDIRRQNKLPPFQRFISIILTGDNENKLEKEVQLQMYSTY